MKIEPKIEIPVTLDLNSLVKLANCSIKGPILFCSQKQDLTLGIILDTEGCRLTLWHGVNDPEVFDSITKELT